MSWFIYMPVILEERMITNAHNYIRKMADKGHNFSFYVNQDLVAGNKLGLF